MTEIVTQALACVGAATIALSAVALLAEYVSDRERRRLGHISLKGKCVVVTGAGTGIGKAIAEYAHRLGAQVVLCGRRRAPLDAVAAVLGSRTSVVADCDVTKENDCQRLLTAAEATGVDIALVVLNAGRSCCGEFDETEESLAMNREMIELNFMANVRLAQLFLPALKKSRGAFLAISSLSGLFPTFRGNAYCAAKHALNGFFDSVRVEQIRNGVSCTVSCPSYAISDVHTSQLTNTGAPPPQRDRSKFMTAEFVAEQSVKAAIRREPRIVLPKAANIPHAALPSAENG